MPACSVVVEAVVAYEIANAFLEKFGGDCMTDIKASYDAYCKRIAQYKSFKTSQKGGEAID